MKTKFYHFRQNNSGGSFTVDSALDVHVVIEATDSKSANHIAEGIGIYFDGCYEGIDCHCCGDRWYEVDDHDSKDYPHMYGEKIENNTIKKTFSHEKGVCGKIHYLDGRVEEVKYSN